jgi:hypothetical protein
VAAEFQLGKLQQRTWLLEVFLNITQKVQIYKGLSKFSEIFTSTLYRFGHKHYSAITAEQNRFLQNLTMQ